MSDYIITCDDEVAMWVGNDVESMKEIVRCRDCKHFTPKGKHFTPKSTHKFENGKVNADSCEYVRGLMLQITPDGFCKWGERV